MEQALQRAFSRLAVNRTAMPGVNAFLHSPEGMIANAAKVCVHTNIHTAMPGATASLYSPEGRIADAA